VQRGKLKAFVNSIGEVIAASAATLLATAAHAKSFGFEIDGFETGDHFVYVISDLSEQQNRQMMAAGS